MANRHQATSTNVEDYWQLFVNRRAYVLQSMRPHAESGRYYYYRPKAGKNGEPVALTAGTLRRHLEGDVTLGVYAMNAETQRCKWIAMDGDYKESLKHLCELQWELQQQKVEAALEQSRRGAHLWIFGEQPLLARQCRLLISGLAEKLGIPVKGVGTAEGIEIFPKHDELKDGDFGNAIRGPLGIHRAISARFWFYGADYSLDNQLAFLKRVTKLSENHLSALLQKLGQRSEPTKKELTHVPRWPYLANQRQFHILDHIEVRRKTGRNWITRCPSCAGSGRDRSGDNLAISVDEPQKYICWAGCTKEMIRAALGCPIPERREAIYATRYGAGLPGSAMELGPANWKPLELRIGHRCEEFMWMGREQGLEYYKHIDTRRYLILDAKGRSYVRQGGDLERGDFRKEFRRVVGELMPEVFTQLVA